MKKTFLLIIACVLVLVNAQAQSSEVEATSQLTKAEQFKLNNSFIKETEIYKYNKNNIQIFTKLFTDLKTGEQLVALEFHPSKLVKAITATSGLVAEPLGYVDMDQVDDLLLALETILNEYNNAAKNEKYTISYTAPGGIDVLFFDDGGQPQVWFRKKWFKIDDYGMRTNVYSEGFVMVTIKVLPDVISSIKEAQMIAIQSLNK